MYLGTSNKGTVLSYQAWQSHRHANANKNGVTNNMPTKNTESKMSVSEAAYAAESPVEFTSWLDDEKNYVERKINGKMQNVRQITSVSCNLPDDVYYDFVTLAAADKTELEDGALTYALRSAVWSYINRDGYAEWAAAEAARIQEERSTRMKGTATERAAKVKALDTENVTLRSEIEELKTALAKLTNAS